MTNASYKVISFALTFGLCVTVAAQAPNRSNQPDNCRGPVYNVKDLTKRAKIISYPDTSALTKAATEYNFRGTISAVAVFCRSGHVTDIQVNQKLPRNLDEFVMRAIGSTRFAPAEMNYHTVSERTQFEFSINSPDEQIDPAAAEGRLLERLEIMGNRTVDDQRIKSLIKMQLGEPFQREQMEKDLQALLATGFFDPKQTRAYTESGDRGGVGVVFEVMERPFIREIKFAGLLIDESVALAALKTLDVQTGARYNSEKMNQARQLLRHLIETNGRQISSINLKVALLDAMTINLEFVITN
jgi:hypothetical protein